MSKKDFIALADTIREHNARVKSVWGEGCRMQFQPETIAALADFCASQNGRFNRERWLGYIAGTNGPSGGAVKAVRS